MAIDQVKKVWVISPAAQAREVPERLAQIGLMHVAEVPLADSPGAAVLARLAADTREIEARIRKLAEILDILGAYSKTVRDLLSNFIPTPIETTRAELDAALAAIGVDRLHLTVKDLAARRAALEAMAEEAFEQIEMLGGFRSLHVPLPAEGTLRWTRAGLWHGSVKQARRVLGGGLAPKEATLEELGVANGDALVASVCLAEHEGEVAPRLRELGFEAVAAPEKTTTLDAYVAAIEKRRRESLAAAKAATAELKGLGKLHRPAELVLGYWEERRETALAAGKMAATGHAAVLTGYVRVRDLARFEAEAAAAMPHASLVAEDPTPQDSVPVSLTCSRVFRPAQFLVEMFGLPSYSAFDPSAFLMLSFVVFYGFCLGDAVYGLVQLAIALALMKRYRSYPGLRNFFALLAWGAVSSFIVGVLTGSWAADIWSPKYLGEGNPLEKLASALMIGDPLQKPLVVLGIALAMGVLNQLWGITMKFYSCWRQGDKRGAIFDAGFWYLVLPGLVLLVAWFFSTEPPAWPLHVGGALMGVGGLGLVLTNGRKEKSLAGKAIVGLVSLYGIVGSYGCLSFVGDTLSYSRLLALALTTTIVGMAINIIGAIINQMLGLPMLVGIVVFAVVAVPAHFLNLVLSGLGAFIHSARLIFVEFFGRFYEPGAQRFAPLGSTGGRIRVMD